MKKVSIALALSGMLSITTATAQSPATIVVQAGKTIAPVQPTMWGVFFEDINFGADGGLYAELVKNRSFEFSMPMMGWRETRRNTGNVLITNHQEMSSANPRYAKITINAPDSGYQLVNEGFRGMGLKANDTYDFSMWADMGRARNVQLEIELLNEKNQVIGSSPVAASGSGWKKYVAAVTAKETTAKGKLRLVFKGTGVVDADMISLFPRDTWKGRPGGLRKDLVQLLADMKPGFVRFPGGCIVEGRDLNNRYQWKKTVGPVESRELIINRWNTEFAHRSAPDYFQSFGLGFYEYFLLSEDLGAQPLPILNCGMACQYNTGEVVDLDELEPYIQDALDLIEFANGSVQTKWGKLRADMGHPAPFNLTMLGVGNEQWDVQYIERYKRFEKRLKEKYPEIKIISGSGPYYSGPQFEYAWKELKKLGPAFIDEHYYVSPDWFFNNAKRYDSYDRTGPKVFAGEYAAHGKEDKAPESRNTWLSALAEAAYMTGLERNADVVQMCAYAPLFAHVEAWQWRPDLIWFDNLKAVGTPNYYVQKLYANYKGTKVVPALLNGVPVTGQDSLYASAVIDEPTGKLYVKLVNNAAVERVINIQPTGWKNTKKVGVKTLSSTDLMQYNSVEEPTAVTPKESTGSVKKGMLQLTVPAKSFQVIEVGNK
ncbi:alpha-L-arabinofuranosidase C-terminal domain-containing protein [Parasegetibacter sp. NRK P23]|uniref:alpha-L-arabinofuranosidase C-terminal domain-containing protein n=1 Tax=Parasegetibacter sp. NRK P23 TaxID=2942999 RepID=UPI0020443F58|nr:alpha-L-arabinofuranosidase C-terminal domain-containing protein [Parasegetibacter sp. NRK P23]MCM5530144.1 alpha-L-arabinofuranosidase [Parasegetibacter sp. NRK P23]